MSRYASIKEKGFNEEDATNLNQVTKALLKAGVVAVDQAGQLRDFGTVVDELMGKWSGLDENTKRYVATTLAGSHQMNRFLVLMENSDDALKNYETAMNAAGTANKKFAIWQESSKAAIDRLKASWEEFWQKSLNSGVIMSAVEILKKFVNIITQAGGVIPIVAGLLAGVLTAGIMAVRAGVTILNVQLSYTNILLGGLPLIIGLVVSGLTAFGFSLKNTTEMTAGLLKEQHNEVKSVDELVSKYELLKSQYDAAVAKGEDVQDIKGKIASTIEELSRIYPDYIIKIDDETTAYERQIGVIKTLNSEKRKQMKEKAELELLANKTEIEKARNEKAVADNVTAMYNSKKLKPLSGENMTSFGLPNSEEQKYLIKALGVSGLSVSNINSEEGLAEAVRLIQNKASSSVDAVADADKNIKLIEEVLEYENGVLYGNQAWEDGYKSEFKERQYTETKKRTKVTGNGDEEGGKGNTSKSSQTAKQLELYIAINSEIEKYKSTISQTDTKLRSEKLTLKEKNQLINEQIENYRKLQKLLSEKADGVRGERTSLANLITGGVFTGEGDQMVLTNSESLLSSKLAQRNSAIGTDGFDKIDAEYEELHKNITRFLEIQSRELKGLSQEWWDYNNAIQTANKSIEEGLENEAKLRQTAAQEKLDAITSTEKLIQDMIKKGVDKQKELYEEDLENYRKVTDDKIDELERGWAAQDFNKDIKEQTDKRQLLQNEINILSLDTSFGGKSRVRELKKQLAEMDVKIADDQEKRKRELVKQSLEDSLKDKEDDIDEKKKFLDKEFADEKVAAMSRESLLKGSFNNLTALLPNFFTNLTISTNQSFLGIMKEYQSKFGSGLSNVKSELEQVMKTAEMAVSAVKNVNTIGMQAKAESYKYTPPIEKAKEDIGKLQDKWWAIQNSGVMNFGDAQKQKDLETQADAIRAKFGISKTEQFRGYVAQTQSLVGTYANGGMNTRNGYVQLHGTQARPEWIFNSDQMNNFIRNMISGTSGYTPAMAGNGGINLSININGNADSSTITGIKNAGMNILSQIKKSINKNGVGNS